MSTFKNLIAILPHPQGELIQSLVQGTNSSVRKRVCQDAVMRQLPGGLMCRFSAFVRECWRRRRIMEAATDQGEALNPLNEAKSDSATNKVWSDNS
jgi:hypothetical protein